LKYEFEYRNPKQSIADTEDKQIKQTALERIYGRFSFFGSVSNFDIRISNFASADAGQLFSFEHIQKPPPAQGCLQDHLPRMFPDHAAYAAGVRSEGI
jgi:hypothetical protein